MFVHVSDNILRVITFSMCLTTLKKKFLITGIDSAASWFCKSNILYVYLIIKNAMISLGRLIFDSNHSLLPGRVKSWWNFHPEGKYC